MPQSIRIKSSTVAGKVPAAGDLAAAELGINLADQKLYSKDAGGTVFEIGGGSSVTVADTAPASPSAGDLWWDTADADGGRLFIWYVDADGGQWVEASPQKADNNFWGRTGTTLSPATAGDDVDLGTGDLSAAAGTFSGALTVSPSADYATNPSFNVLDNGVSRTYRATNDANGAIAVWHSDVGSIHRPRVTFFANGSIALGGSDSNDHYNGRWNSSGTLEIGDDIPANGANITLNANGQIEAPGWYIPATAGGAISTNRRIQAASGGGASNAVFIGNAQIQVSSDRRIKDNIKDTELDALDAIQKIKVRDFTWNDPNDVSYNNRNARGIWTGVIAQELVDVLPFVVNAPRKEEDLSLDYESEDIWTLDQSQLCPVLVKALQQALTRIEALEAEVQALKGGN